MRRLALPVALVFLAATLAAGCRAPVYTLRVQADPGVRWEGYYGVARKTLNGTVDDRLRITGNGDWELTISPDQGAIQGLIVSVSRQGEGGTLRVQILRDGDVIAENSAGGPREGASCMWGTPP